MAEWNSNPQWSDLESINGGFNFKSFSDISASDFNKLVENMQFLYTNYLNGEGGELDMKRIYPVGSIYLSLEKTFNPAEAFGGTWQKLTDRFLVGAGGAYDFETKGGEATHTLTTAEMPRHSHYQTISNGSWAYDAVYSSGGANTSMSGYYIDGSVMKSGKGGRANTEYVGGDGAHNNLPPYLAVYMWRRTA